MSEKYVCVYITYAVKDHIFNNKHTKLVSPAG